jgi:hypothetical protein
LFQNGESALTKSAFGGHHEIVEILMQNPGLEINIQNKVRLLFSVGVSGVSSPLKQRLPGEELLLRNP